MLNETLKTHLNQIDSSLKSVFGTVKFDHREDGYYSIVEVSDNTINEDLAPIMVKFRIEHEKLNRDTNQVNWSYSINPDKDGSTVIERTSHIDNIGNDLLDIVVNKRMDKNYIDSCLLSLIQEDVEHIDEFEVIKSQIRKLRSVIPHAKTRAEAEELQQEIIELEEKLPYEDDIDESEDEFQIGESIVFTDYEYNEHEGIIQKKISLQILDKEYKGWVVKTENGEERKVMDYDINRDSRLPKWWNN